MTQLPTDHDEAATGLTALMTRAVDDLRPPVERLRHATVTEGRRIRRRRHGVAVLGGVAAAAALAVLVAPGAGGPSAERSHVADDPSPSASPAPTPVPPGHEPPAGFWSMPSTEMRERLRDLLPDGAHLSGVQLAPSDRGPGEPAVSKGWVLARVARDGIAGESTIELMLWSPGHSQFTETYAPDGSSPDATATAVVSGPSDLELTSCPGNLTSYTSCTDVTEHGVHVGRTSDLVSGDVTQREVTVEAGTGLVYAALANTTDDKWGPDSPPSGAAPALTSDELLAIATAATWTDWTPRG
jgi:hypothetical protein